MIPGLGRSPWRRDWLPTPVFSGFPGGSDGKESACNVRDLGSIPGLGKSPGGGHGNPFQCSCLESPHEQRSLVGYSPWGHKESQNSEAQPSTYTWLGFLGGAGGEEPCCQCRRCKRRGNPGWGRPPGERNGNPLRYSCLEEPGGLQSPGLQSQTQLKPLSTHTCIHVATIPGTVSPFGQALRKDLIFSKVPESNAWLAL